MGNINILIRRYWFYSKVDDYVMMKDILEHLREYYISCTQPETKTILAEQIQIMQRRFDYLHRQLDNRGFEIDLKE